MLGFTPLQAGLAFLPTATGVIVGAGIRAALSHAVTSGCAMAFEVASGIALAGFLVALATIGAPRTSTPHLRRASPPD